MVETDFEPQIFYMMTSIGEEDLLHKSKGKLVARISFLSALQLGALQTDGYDHPLNAWQPNFRTFVYRLCKLYIYFQIITGVILNNITPLNNLLLNSYFKNLTVELHDLYILNMYANFHINQLLFTIRFINLFFMKYFKLHKLEFKQLIDGMTIDL